jgi:CRISPR/Cas system-associated exonuclease Cas4 (RecB family)
MKVIRASEIGSYLYCRRAWWYRWQGIESGNQAEMKAGTQLHHQHGRKVLTAVLQRFLAWGLFLSALILLAWFGAQNLLAGR